MDPLEARIECLRLAIDTSPEDATSDTVLVDAKKYADFVLGVPVVESASARKRGRDDPK